MLPIPDALAGFYLVCFGIGFVFVVASLFLGLSHDVVHLPGFGDGAGIDHGGGMDVSAHGDGGMDGTGSDSGGDAATHPAAHQSGQGISPFNLSTIMTFVTWFGGAGYLLRAYGGIGGFLSVAFAGLAGLVGGTIIFFLMAKVLLPGQRFLDEGEYRMEGTVAKVTMPVGPDRVGEIVYNMGGSRRSDGARSTDGSRIEKGTEVVIVKYEKGIAYVEPWSSYVARG